MDFEPVRDMIEPGSFGLYKVTTDCSKREIWFAARGLREQLNIPNADVDVQLLDHAHSDKYTYLIIVRQAQRGQRTRETGS